jgi:hypothetical protein
VLQTIWNVLSLGRRYVAGALVYAGLALILASAVPDPSPAVAEGTECGPYTPCPEGSQCCHGTCIPNDYVCCDDGTNGPSASCGCWSPAPEEPTTLCCPEPE